MEPAPSGIFTDIYNFALYKYVSEVEVLKKRTMSFFTDGSQLKVKVGGGVFCRKLSINSYFRLLDDCNVFQVEVAADILL